MKTYLLNIIPRIRKYSARLNSESILTDKHWVFFNESNEKIVFVFRKINNNLLISRNGVVQKAKWDLLGENSILIDRQDGSYLLKNGFVDESILALNLDGTEECVIFINEELYNKGINKLNEINGFLEDKYLNMRSSINYRIESQNSGREKTNLTFLKPNEIFDANNYKTAIIQLEEIRNYVNPEFRSVFKDILVSKLRLENISLKYKNYESLVNILEQPQIGFDTLASLYCEKYDNASFLYDFDEYIRKYFE